MDAAAAGRYWGAQGETVGIDATTLEANADLRIVRRDTGESYQGRPINPESPKPK